jgi:aryl-alcohol dehydrogenase-like predicted oxidoreductase
MWLGVSDDESRKALHEALDLGVTFIDTALAYGDGHSEKNIHAVLAERGGRDEVVVATKIPPKDWKWPGSPDKRLKKVFPGSWLEKCVERSLRHLGVEALQLEQLHVWHDAWLDHPEWEETRAAMERLEEQGKVLHWGISINDHAPETALRLMREESVIETVQVIYNIFDRSAERTGLFDPVRDNNLGVIARVPFDEGALTGNVRADTVFPKGDWRNDYFGGNRRAEAGRRADALAELLGDEAETLPELALRFCLSRKEVTTVIPGMRRPEHARANTAVSDGRALSVPLLEKLHDHAWDKNWY